jgi:hypothetical protein
MLLDVANLTTAVYIPFTYLVFLCKGELRLELMAEHSGGARLSTQASRFFTIVSVPVDESQMGVQSYTELCSSWTSN